MTHSDYNQWVEKVSEWRDSADVIPRLVRDEIMKSKLDPGKPKTGPRSLVFDPLSVQFAMGYKDRRYSLSYDVLKRIPQQLALISAILQTRCNQVSSFAVPFRLSKSLGFAIKHKNPARTTTKGEREFIQSVETFIYNCGHDAPNPHNPHIRDDFETFLKKIVRDSLMYDQTCFEVIPDRKGQPYEFLAVDASTIRLAASNVDADFSTALRAGMHAQGYNPKDVSPNHTWPGAGQPYKTMQIRNPEIHDVPSYIQLVNGQIKNSYTRGELAFGVRNPRSDIYVQGYGYSELEQLVTIITAHLYAEEYNRRFFMQGSAPKGILNFKGDNLTPDMLEVFKRQWRSNLEGVENSWRTPILQSEQGVDWIDLHPSNQEMEYSMWIEYLIKITCFTGNTPVTMADGSTKPIQDVAPGDLVHTHTGQVREVQNLQIKKHEGELFHIRAGETMEVTGEHPLWVASSILSDGIRQITEPTWKNASDVVEGTDYLCVPKKTYIHTGVDQTLDLTEILDAGTFKLSPDGKQIAPVGNAGKWIARNWPITPELAYVLGLYTAEGNTTDSAAYFTFEKNELLYVEAVTAFAQQIGVHARQYSAKESTANVCLHSSLVASVLSALCGSKALNKCVPAVIMHSPKDVQKAYISGVFAGDGSVPDFAGGNATATLSLVSNVALEQLRHLLLIQEVYAHRYTVTNAGFTSDNQINRLDINGTFAARLSTWLQGPKGEKLRARVAALSVHRSTVYESPTYYYVPVTEVWTTEYSGNVYNIEVAGEHTYQAHRFAVHNCAVFLIDPAELNFDMHGGVQQTPLFESSQEWKLKASRDRGLKPMLRFIAKMINDNIVSKLDDHFMFDFMGLDELTEQEKHELRKEQLATYMTLNEIRREEDLSEQPDGDVVLNPTYTTYIQQKRQFDAQQQMAAGAAGGATPAAGAGGEAGGQPPSGGASEPSGPQYADGFTKSIGNTKVLEISLDDDDSWVDLYRG